MTTCDKVRPRLTAYLDGELADDRGSVVRGHLRECEACRDAARDEAALRDGLRALPMVDPPSTLWAGVQARLAAAEVADARKPRWRSVAERWARWARRARWTPTMPQLGAAAVAAVVAVVVLTWRGQRGEEPVAAANPSPGTAQPRPAPEPARLAVPVAPPEARPGAASSASGDDVTADLAAEPSRTTESYARVVQELMTLAEQARARWSDRDKAAFDARVAGMRATIARADQPRSVQRAQRSLIRYLQSAVVRDDTVLASGGPQ